MVSPFLKLFARSPFKPLSEHMETVYACVKTLAPFFDAVRSQNWAEAETLHQNIVSLETKADDLKRDLRLKLPKDLFLPVNRSDLLEVLSYQDYMANQAEDIAGLVFGRQMTLPEPLWADYRELITLSIDACRQAYKAIRELNELLEAGFSGQEKQIIREMLDKLHHIEHTCDDVQMRLFKTLYGLEATLAPVSAMFIYKLIDWTGKLADLAEKVADRLQICIAS